MGALDFMATEEAARASVSPLVDPFNQESIEAIHIHIYPKHTFHAPARCQVEFKNGNTGGTQQFQGTDLGAMMAEVQAFIDSLSKEK